MNPKYETERIWYNDRYFERKKVRYEYTFEDMQKDMENLNKDINALNNMDIDDTIKFIALTELNSKKYKLLAEMHEKLNEMYY